MTGFGSDKVRALLAHLAAEAEVAHRREKLAGLLWPERAEASARNNLRHALAVLRQAVGDTSASRPAGSPVAGRAGAPSAPPHLLMTPQAIRFDVESDAAASAQLLRSSSAAREAPDSRLARLDQAVSLYRGDFLDGFSLPDSAAFDEWLLLDREHYRRLMSEALGCLIDGWEQNADHERPRSIRGNRSSWTRGVRRHTCRPCACCGGRAPPRSPGPIRGLLSSVEAGAGRRAGARNDGPVRADQEPGRRRTRDRVPPSARRDAAA